MVFGSGGGGRSSKIVSGADDQAAIFHQEHHHHGSPLKALKRMGDKLKHHTAVTTTEEEPGVSDSDQAAGTSVPVANRSKQEALNAGFQEPSKSRRSFSSFRSFRSHKSPKPSSSTPQPGSPRQDGATAGDQQLTPEQLEAKQVAQNPQDHLKNAGKGQSAQSQRSRKEGHSSRENRIANTETFFEDSEQQKERERRVMEHLKNEHKPKNAHDFFAQAQDKGQVSRTASIGSESMKDAPEKIEDTNNGANANANSAHDGANANANGDANGAHDGANGGATGAAAESQSGGIGGPEFSDAPDPSESAQLNRTVSQPSPQAAGALSPRNRFVGSNGGSRSPETTENLPQIVTGNRVTGDIYANSAAANTMSSLGGSKYQDPTDGSAPSAPGAVGAAGGASGAQPPNGPTTGGSASVRNGVTAGDATPDGSPSRHNKQFSPTSTTFTHDTGHTGTTDVDPNDVQQHQQAQDRSGADGGAGEDGSAGTQQEPSEEDSSDGYYEDSEVEDESFSMPEGSVPGLGLGDEDPRLPGERRKPKKKKPAEQPSQDLESEKAKARFKSQQDEIRLKRERQAAYAGWRQIGGWDKNTSQHTREDAETLLQKSTLLETYVSEKYLGDWYQNTAIIVFTAFFSWLFGRYRFSVSWISLVLLFAATAYRTSIRRMRRNYRDDLMRESLLERHTDKDSESMEWLNGFMIKFWLIYEPSLSQMITQIGNEVLAEQTPGFIKSMKLDKFTLGTKAPRIDFVRSFPRTDPQVVVIDMGASFTPNDTMDLTARQLQTKVNPKIQLGVRIGKGFISKNFPVLLEDMNFKGKFRVRFKLMERPPHIQTLDFSFLAPPEFDFKLKPIGGDKLGFDINIIPGLSKFIKDIVNANLGPMVYAPNAFQINVEQLMAGVGPMSGVGVLSIQVISAENLKEDADGRVDPYVVVKDKNKRVLGHTKIKSNTTSPVWNEIINVIIQNTNDNVLLEVFDFDESAPDRSIGQAPIKVNELYGSDVIKRKITSGGAQTGSLKYIAHYSPVTMPREDDDHSKNSPRDTKSGILSLKVVAARDLDPTVSKTAKVSPFAEIEFSGRLIDSTKVAKDTNNPEWNHAAEHIVLDKVATLFFVRVRDHRSKIAQPPVIGVFKMKLNKMLVQAEKGMKWFPLEDGKGEIKLEMQWKPANITVGGTTNNYVEPIGVMRLNIMNGRNLRNLEHIGKIDPYARVFIGHRLAARTDWYKNTLNPVWNQTLYVPVQSELQNMTMEVMDVENHGKDRSLGAFKVKLQNVIKQDEFGNYKLFISDKTFTNKLMLPNRGPKGTLEYTMEFFPAIPVVSPSERERMQNDMKLIALLKKKVQENGGDPRKALTDEERHELAAREERLDYSGVNMPIEDQLKYDAGVFAIAIVSLEGHRVGQSLKVIANNEPYAMFTSPVFKSSRRYSSDECPDFVSGQMPLSSLRFELGTFNSKSLLGGLDEVEDGSNDEENAARDPNAAEITVSCFELIREATQQGKVYQMKNGAKIELQARFFPLPGLVIDEEEDISNTGCIEIDLQRAEGVAAADSTGLSDPYTAFYLNNGSDKIYKSKIKKATLDPVWNEQFRFAVEDVKNSFIKAIINDWDMGNRDDFLGGHRFDFSELEPLVWKDYAVPLEKIKKNREVRHHKDAPGTLYLRIRYLPGYLQKVGDKYLVGGASVTRAAGGLVGGGMAAAGVAAGAASGIAHTPQHLLNKITGHKDEKEEQLEAYISHYNAQIESLTGLNGVKYEIQIRCFLLTDSGEKEVFRSSNLKLENGEVTLTNEFQFKALPETELGVKVLAVKSLGRHSDIAQSSTDLEPGLKEIMLTKDAVLRLSIAQESE